MQICKKDKCTGCGLCIDVCPKKCIQMKSNEEGFIYPDINMDLCVECNQCKNKCPVNKAYISDNYEKPLVYACFNKEDNIRLDSTSGGLFSAIAKYIISKGGKVVGVTVDEKLKPKHIIIDNEEDLELIRGSKYIQSRTTGIYKKVKELLDKNEIVLFSGTACQISALYSYVGKEKSNLYTCEVICHGIGSEFVNDKQIKFIEDETKSKVEKLIYRSKKEGWTTSMSEYKLKNGTSKYVVSTDNLFMRTFYLTLCHRKSCYECKYAKLPRVSDIMIGDFWGADKLNFEQEELKKGISLALINNVKGEEIFDNIREFIGYREETIEHAAERNKHILVSNEQNPIREEFFKDIKTKEREYLMEKYCK